MFTIIFSLLTCVFAIHCIKSLRVDYFQSLLARDIREFRIRNTSDYISKFSNDLELLKNMYFTNLTLMIYLIIKIVLASISLFVLDYRIAIITIILLTMPLYIPNLVKHKLMHTQNEYLRIVECNLNKITDWLSKYELIKMFSIENKMIEQFKNHNHKVMDATLQDKKMNNVTTLLTACMSYFSHVIILLAAIFLVYNGTFTVGMFLIAVGMIDQLSYPIISIASSYQNLISVKDIAQNIMTDIDKYTYIKTKDMALPLHTSIRLENISFQYHSQKELISNLSFVFEKGKKYLIRGESGSGKTTLINLILNYYDVTKGQIYYDDHLVKDIHPFQFVTVIRQSAALLDDTIMNNLTLFLDEYKMEELLHVLKLVNLNKFADAQHLDFSIGENGNRLSGGEGKGYVLHELY